MSKIILKVTAILFVTISMTFFSCQKEEEHLQSEVQESSLNLAGLKLLNGKDFASVLNEELTNAANKPVHPIIKSIDYKEFSGQEESVLKEIENLRTNKGYAPYYIVEDRKKGKINVAFDENPEIFGLERGLKGTPCRSWNHKPHTYDAQMDFLDLVCSTPIDLYQDVDDLTPWGGIKIDGTLQNAWYCNQQEDHLGGPPARLLTTINTLIPEPDDLLYWKDLEYFWVTTGNPFTFLTPDQTGGFGYVLKTPSMWYSANGSGDSCLDSEEISSEFCAFLNILSTYLPEDYYFVNMEYFTYHNLSNVGSFNENWQFRFVIGKGEFCYHKIETDPGGPSGN